MKKIKSHKVIFVLIMSFVTLHACRAQDSTIDEQVNAFLDANLAFLAASSLPMEYTALLEVFQDRRVQLNFTKNRYNKAHTAFNQRDTDVSSVKTLIKFIRFGELAYSYEFIRGARNYESDDYALRSHYAIAFDGVNSRRLKFKSRNQLFSNYFQHQDYPKVGVDHRTMDIPTPLDDGFQPLGFLRSFNPDLPVFSELIDKDSILSFIKQESLKIEYDGDVMKIILTQNKEQGSNLEIIFEKSVSWLPISFVSKNQKKWIFGENSNQICFCWRKIWNFCPISYSL